MNRSFRYADIYSEVPKKHSIPIVTYTPQLIKKYQIKSTHKTSIRPIQEISVSIKEIEGLKSALTRIKTPRFLDSSFQELSQKTTSLKTPSINKSKFENVSILSKSFAKYRSKSPKEAGLFWLNDKDFVRNFEVLNKEKLLIRTEKIKNVDNRVKKAKRANNKLSNKTSSGQNNKEEMKEVSSRNEQNKNNSDNYKVQAPKRKKNEEIETRKEWKKKDKFSFSPFSRRFIREVSPEETVFVLPPKRPGKNFLLNI